jgi:hypothetical protein
MARTFASKKTKRRVLDLLLPGLTALGYRLHRQESSSLQTELRRDLNEDVSVSLNLDFFDGPLAGADLTRLSAVVGIASKRLLETYSRLHESSPTTDYFPIAISLRSMALAGREGSWFFEFPNKTSDARAFLVTAAGPLEDLLSDYDSAEKQIHRLLNEKSVDAFWNQAYFEPIAYILLGQFSAAKRAAERVLARPAQPAFIDAYKQFYANLLRIEA